MEKRLTPMQELIEWVNKTDSFVNLKAKEMVIDKATELLEKEKFAISTSYHNGHLHFAQNFRQTGEEYYNNMYK